MSADSAIGGTNNQRQLNNGRNCSGTIGNSFDADGGRDGEIRKMIENNRVAKPGGMVPIATNATVHRQIDDLENIEVDFSIAARSTNSSAINQQQLNIGQNGLGAVRGQITDQIMEAGTVNPQMPLVVIYATVSNPNGDLDNIGTGSTIEAATKQLLLSNGPS